MTDLDMMTPDGTPTMGRGGPRTCIGGPTANVSPIELELRIRTQFSCILGFEVRECCTLTKSSSKKPARKTPV